MLILPSNNQTFGFYQGQPSNIGILTQILQPENRQPKPCLPVGLTHWRVAHCCFAAQKARRVLVSGMTQTVYLTTSEIHLNMCASCMNFGMDGLCQCVFSTRRPWLLDSAGPKIFGDWIRTRSKLTHKKIWFKTPHQRPSILVKGQAHGLLQRRPKQVPSDQKHHWSPHQTIRQRQHPRQSPPAFPVSAWRDHNCPGTFSAKATSKTSSKWLAKCTWMLERISFKKKSALA